MSVTTQINSLPAEPIARSAQVASGMRRSGRKRWWLVLALVWSLGGMYGGQHLKRGWVPHDEGAFAQSADRVLRGELPHRDYMESYTGGLTYLNAVAFRYLGENFATTRYVLFAVYLAWLPVVYWIASQLAPEWVAGGVTLLAVAWSLPNYSAAVPSWYNLFFATFGSAALFQYLRARTWKWPFVAGLCGGLSFLAKTAGLYYGVAAFFFFVFLEQTEGGGEADALKRRRPWYTASLATVLILFLASLTRLLKARGGLEEFVNFVFPALALVCLLLVNELRARRRVDRERLMSLAKMLAPFAAGFALPLAIFLAPYVRAHAIAALLNGIFILPAKRITGAYMAPPEMDTILAVLGVIAILAVGARLRGIGRLVLTAGAAALSLFLLIFSANYDWAYQIAWHSAYWVIPPLTILGVMHLRRREATEKLGSGEHRQQLFLLLAMMALCGLVQFPFASPIYFCYVAPLAILAAAAMLRDFPRIPRPLLAVLFLYYLLFVVFRATPTFIYDMGQHYERDFETQALDLPRAGNLRVDGDHVQIYSELIPLVQKHAGSAEIYAAPDCPEVYFLAGYKNPTPVLFDFFDDPAGRTERILKMIDSRPIRVVVIDLDPGFSGEMPDELHDALAERFPAQDRVGHFEVRWEP